MMLEEIIRYAIDGIMLDPDASPTKQGFQDSRTR